jgi:2-oxo-4-hydroxy-4-carboxy-5-ureidoimidazoline decarboxylase
VEHNLIASVVTLNFINQLAQPEFTVLLGPLYEDSPWVAENTWGGRPFASEEALISALNQTMRAAPPEKQMELVRAHPELAGRFKAVSELTESSQEEQKSAGLTSLTPAEADQFLAYNDQYKARFHFPFIICAKLNNVSQILSAFKTRIENSPEQEFQTALGEIEKIARLRLEKLLATL